jgi:hypothetical protein
MVVSLAKAKELIELPPGHVVDDELRRDGAVFFVGASLPARPTLEAIFDSDCLAPAELFVFRFPTEEAFRRSEELVRLVKKNFKGYVLGQFVATPSFALVDSAYAAGIDLLDLPLASPATDAIEAARLAALEYASTVFPRWATAATLQGWERGTQPATRTIDLLLERKILPLLAVGAEAAHLSIAEVGGMFEHLARGWRRKRAVVKPLLPLLALTAPFAPPPRRGLVASLFDKAYDTQLRTTSDLRRLLRVREVVESFDSAGL